MTMEYKELYDRCRTQEELTAAFPPNVLIKFIADPFNPTSFRDVFSMCQCNHPERSFFADEIYGEGGAFFRFDLVDGASGRTPAEAAMSHSALFEHILNHLQRANLPLPETTKERMFARAVTDDMDDTFDVLVKFFPISGPEAPLRINLKDEAIRVALHTAEGVYDHQDKLKVLQILTQPASAKQPPNDLAKRTRDAVVLSSIRQGDFRTLAALAKAGVDLEADAEETILEAAVNCKNQSIVKCLFRALAK
jgi:hypothetical protein